MPGKDLGTKHTCFKCGTRFYDLRKPALICPKCGADQRESPALRAPAAERKRPAPKPPPEPEVAVAAEDLEEEGEEVLDEDEEPAADDEG